MIILTDILSNLYTDRDTRFLQKKLEQYDLFGPLKRSVSQLNTIIHDQNAILDSLHFVPAGHIASMLLHAINARISKVEDISEKTALENMLGDICQEILNRLLPFIKTNRQQLLSHIVYALKDTCEFYNYDFSLFAQSFKLESILAYNKSLQYGEKAKKPPVVPSYIWKGKAASKKQLINVFVERGLTRGRKNLTALFDAPRQSLQIKFDSSQAEILLHLFYYLKKNKHLAHRGKCGFYQVLEYHASGFHEFFLRGQLPKHRINALRQNKAVWAENQARIEKWLTPLVPA